MFVLLFIIKVFQFFWCSLAYNISLQLRFLLRQIRYTSPFQMSVEVSDRMGVRFRFLFWFKFEFRLGKFLQFTVMKKFFKQHIAKQTNRFCNCPEISKAS